MLLDVSTKKAKTRVERSDSKSPAHSDSLSESDFENVSSSSALADSPKGQKPLPSPKLSPHAISLTASIPDPWRDSPDRPPTPSSSDFSSPSESDPADATSVEFTHLKVGGGVTNGDLCMQVLADIGGFSVVRPTMRESTALGSALLAGSAVRLFGWDLERPEETMKEVNTEGASTFEPRRHVDL